MNITTAVFKPGARRATAESLTQYDYGQVLSISGLQLPEFFETHFSNKQFDGNSKPWIGQNNQVEIPDEYLESGDPIYALIFLHYGEDDGKTEYRITIPIDKRPRPVDVRPSSVEQNAISQTIAALNTGVSMAEQMVDQAEAARDAILNMDVAAETVDRTTGTSVVKETDAETGNVTLHFYIQDGEKGDKGDKGNIFIPSVTAEGVLSWTETEAEGSEAPESFDIVTAVLNALPVAEEGWF